MPAHTMWSSASADTAHVVPHKPYIAKDWTAWATSLLLTVSYGSCFSVFDTVGFRSCHTVGLFRVTQSHQFWYLLKSVCNFLLVNNTNISYIGLFPICRDVLIQWTVNCKIWAPENKNISLSCGDCGVLHILIYWTV